VMMAAGEKWHFHVRKVDPASDPLVYVLPACDARTCAPGSASDVCGSDTDEHLSFVAPSAGAYLVGIDGKVPGGFPYQLLAIRPMCGNGGMPEHSEGCDDGNLADGDGCDARCRSEVGAAAPTEKEPNDEFTSANVLALQLGAEPLNLTGQIGSSCDADMFVLTIAERARLEVSWLDAAGAACAAELAGSKLEVLAADGLSVLRTASASASMACPRFGDADGLVLDPGTYHLRASAPDVRANYRLAVALRLP
jgi:cysteine-rich repeat protein